MYQFIIKGRNLEELKKAVANIHFELQMEKVVKGTQHNMEQVLEPPHIQQSGRVELPVNPVLVNEMVDTKTGEIVEENIQAAQSAPVYTPALEPATPSNLELDVEGMPWDGRIHTSKKTKVSAGTWKLKRGVDKTLVQQVRSEHNSTLQPITPIQPTTVAPVANPTPVQPATVMVHRKEPTPIPTTLNSGHTVDTFKANFPMIVGNLITEGKLTQEYVNQLKGYFQVAEIWQVNDDQKAEMFESFAGCGLITKVQ